MRNSIQQYWVNNGHRVIVGSIFFAMAFSLLVIVWFPTSRFGKGLAGLVATWVLLVNCFGDVITKETAAKDGNSENISWSKNPIQYSFYIGIQLIIIVFCLWISVAEIAQSFATN